MHALIPFEGRSVRVNFFKGNMETLKHPVKQPGKEQVQNSRRVEKRVSFACGLPSTSQGSRLAVRDEFLCYTRTINVIAIQLLWSGQLLHQLLT